MSEAVQLVLKINRYILNPFIRFLMAAALLLFIWGIIEFVQGRDNAEQRSKGQRHMLFGLIGLAIMVSVFGIMRLVLGTIGVDSSMVDLDTGTVTLPDS